MSYHNLSLSDLMLLDGFSQAYTDGNKEVVEQFLFNNGMNVKKGYKEVKCTHRNLRNMVVECVRFEGLERLDKEWLQSGAASLEATIESSGSLDLQEELRSLNPRNDGSKFEREVGLSIDIPTSDLDWDEGMVEEEEDE